MLVMPGTHPLTEGRYTGYARVVYMLVVLGMYPPIEGRYSGDARDTSTD